MKSQDEPHNHKKNIAEAINGLLEVMAENLQAENPITLHNFGYFFIQKLGERKFKNPKTGKSMIVQPKKKIKFRASPKIRID